MNYVGLYTFVYVHFLFLVLLNTIFVPKIYQMFWYAKISFQTILYFETDVIYW
jgi:hypothetical protein